MTKHKTDNNLRGIYKYFEVFIFIFHNVFLCFKMFCSIHSQIHGCIRTTACSSSNSTFQPLLFNTSTIGQSGLGKTALWKRLFDDLKFYKIGFNLPFPNWTIQPGVGLIMINSPDTIFSLRKIDTALLPCA